MLILSVSYVALQSTVYSLLDKMVIDRLNEEAIELTSAVGPAKDWFSHHSKKTLQIVRVIFAQEPCRSKKKITLYRPHGKNKDTPVLCATLRQGHADLCIDQVCLHFSICAATEM